jgi:hypothetical protein
VLSFQGSQPAPQEKPKEESISERCRRLAGGRRSVSLKSWPTTDLSPVYPTKKTVGSARGEALNAIGGFSVPHLTCAAVLEDRTWDEIAKVQVLEGWYAGRVGFVAKNGPNWW